MGRLQPHFPGSRQTTRPIPVSQKRVHNGERPADLARVRIIGTSTPGVNHGSRGGCRQFTGDSSNFACGDIRLFLSPLRGIVPNMFFQLIQPETPILNKVPVIKILKDQHMGKSQHQRHVRVGPDGMILVCHGGRFGVTGVHDHQFCPLFHGRHEVHAVRGHQGFKPVGAAHDHVLGVPHVRYGDFAKSIQESPGAGDEAHGLVGKGVVRPESLCKAMHKARLHVGARHEHDAAPGIFLGDAAQLLSGMVQGLVPGQALPFPLAPGALSE